MSTIKKEVEIELEYSEICDAVSDLDSNEKLSLIQDCELLEQRSVIDYIDNLDSDEKQEIIDRCDLLDDDFIENHISDLSESEVKDLLENAGHEELLKGNGSSELSNVDSALLEILKKHLSKKDIMKVVEKKDVATLIKAVSGILED
jgi:uncharacterized protein YdaT